MSGVPPLNLSAGPSVSGGGATYGGTTATGDFRYYGRATMAELVAQNIPAVAAIAIMAWLVWR